MPSPVLEPRFARAHSHARPDDRQDPQRGDGRAPSTKRSPSEVERLVDFATALPTCARRAIRRRRTPRTRSAS